MQAIHRAKSVRHVGAHAPLVALFLVAATFSTAGCDSLPGNKPTQGAVIGGAAGGAAGAIIAGEDNRLLGAVIGLAIGAGGGYVVGNELEKKDAREAKEAAAANSKASRFTKEDVLRATTADLDADGNVTIAEVVALQSAGLGEQEIVRRLEATGVVFDLTEAQKQTLRDSGVSAAIVDRLQTINRHDGPIGTRK